MKLKIKNLDWLAGRPVAILNENDAKKMNVFANDRVAIANSKRVYAVIDIFSNLIRKGDIGVSHELTRIINSKNKEKVEVIPSHLSEATFLIRKKFAGFELSKKDMSKIVTEIVHNNLTEAEIAYFTAAEKLKGMSLKETINLTRAMVKTGARLKFKGKYIADKHCVGGIAGNRTTPIVTSICAAAGLILPKTSSRAISSAAGTSDVIETLAKVELSLPKIKSVVKKTGACLAWGGSLGLAPSDDRIIRVERLLGLDIEPQLLASILSKKISAGSKYILIDIPYGKGAKIPNKKSAEHLARKFKQIGKSFHLKLKVVLTNGSRPIGKGMGPILEMIDVVEILKNSPTAPTDLKEKSLFLATEIMKLCKIKNAKNKAEEILISGLAYEKFKQIVNEQNSKKDFEKRLETLKPAKIKKIIKANKSGRIVEVNNLGINSICRLLGTPETKGAGIYLHKKKGNVTKRDKLMTLYAESRTKMNAALKYMRRANPITIK